MITLRESILSSTWSGKFSTPVKWSKKFRSWKKAEDGIIDFYNIKDAKAKAAIDTILDTYDRDYGFPSSFVFDFDFEEKAKNQGVNLEKIESCKSIFTDDRYIIVYNYEYGEYYIWSEEEEDFIEIVDNKILDFIRKI